MVADLLVRPPGGALRFLADDHMSDRSRARQSARRLLGYRFDVLAPGHGEPIVHGGRQTLEDLLREDARRGE
jgi:glyoxylase-like metal-dependent hydrolase (beta-lactamase superfamily II)